MMAPLFYVCPQCAGYLTRQPDTDGVVFTCDNCSKWLIGFSALKKTTDPAYLIDLKFKAKNSSAYGRGCPFCARPLPKISDNLHVCPFCDLVWIGQKEKEALPPLNGAPIKKKPDLIPFLLEKAMVYAGIPLRPGGKDWNLIPWMSLLLFVSVIIVNIAYPKTINGFPVGGTVPMGLLIDHHLDQLIWPIYFIHQSENNLLFNLYFLLLFGTVVENQIGPLLLLGLFLGPSLLSFAAGLFPQIFNGWYFSPGGGVVALMTYYACVFPYRKLEWPRVRFTPLYVILPWLFIQLFVVGLPHLWNRGVGFNTYFLGIVCGLVGGLLAWWKTGFKPDRS